MSVFPRGLRLPAFVLALCAVLSLVVLGGHELAHGAIENKIASKRAAAQALRAAIAAETPQIAATAASLRAARVSLAAIDADLSAKQDRLRATEQALVQARVHLTDLENRLEAAMKALSANLVGSYEDGTPDALTVVLQAHGFADLLERLNGLRLIARQDTTVITYARAARQAVARQAVRFGRLEIADQRLAATVRARRDQAAGVAQALVGRQDAELGARARATNRLHDLRGQLASLQAEEAKLFAAARPVAGGIRINTGGMAQPPPGAPPAVAQVMAAGNAIATLPYVFGGGHGSFRANAYDCSGSISYALAAAGLVSSPLDSTGFESWGLAGPGQWITVYANAGHAFMVVAGWRFDTVALAEGGTRWTETMTGTSGYVARHPPGL